MLAVLIALNPRLISVESFRKLGCCLVPGHIAQPLPSRSQKFTRSEQKSHPGMEGRSEKLPTSAAPLILSIHSWPFSDVLGCVCVLVCVWEGSIGKNPFIRSRRNVCQIKLEKRPIIQAEPKKRERKLFGSHSRWSPPRLHTHTRKLTGELKAEFGMIFFESTGIDFGRISDELLNSEQRRRKNQSINQVSVSRGDVWKSRKLFGKGISERWDTFICYSEIFFPGKKSIHPSLH